MNLVEICPNCFPTVIGRNILIWQCGWQRERIWFHWLQTQKGVAYQLQPGLSIRTIIFLDSRWMEKLTDLVSNILLELLPLGEVNYEINKHIWYQLSPWWLGSHLMMKCHSIQESRKSGISNEGSGLNVKHAYLCTWSLHPSDSSRCVKSSLIVIH